MKRGRHIYGLEANDLPEGATSRGVQRAGASMTERQREARALRAQGLTYREIGERLGVQGSAAGKLCNRERYSASDASYREANRDKRRKWDRAQRRRERGTCRDCGGLMGIGHRHDGTCAKCLTLGKERNWRAIELMWEDGLLLREIAEAMGWSMGHLSVEVDRMRSEGWNLPYRYRRSPKKVAA